MLWPLPRKPLTRKVVRPTRQVIVRLLLRTVRARKPKPATAAGKYAKSMMFIRKWFGDRVFDQVVLATVK
jgi:hypothetical protein